jgi:hypothetical protein
MIITSTATLLGVSIADVNNAWAVGTGGTILKYDGTNWVAVTSGTTAQLNGVWAASPTEAYAVGNGGLILKWNGTNWAQMNSGTTRDLRAISGISGVYAVAVGAGATIVMGTPTAASNAFMVRTMPIPRPSGVARPMEGSLTAPGVSAAGAVRPQR